MTWSFDISNLDYTLGCKDIVIKTSVCGKDSNPSKHVIYIHTLSPIVYTVYTWKYLKYITILYKLTNYLKFKQICYIDECM